MRRKTAANRLGRKAKTAVVFVNGCFDMLHEGHIRFLKEAKKKGGYLIVGLNSDISVRRNKGSSRPIEKQTVRKRKLLGTGIVDRVIIFNDRSPIRLINTIRPDIIVRGHDQKIEKELRAFRFYRVRKYKDISTTKLLKLLNGKGRA